MFCVMGFPLLVQAQGTVQGIVQDKLEAIIGATVLVKGTADGTVTDYDGSYKLQLPAGSHEIEVSYIGYATQTAVVEVIDGKVSTLDFTLAEGISLDEVIVTGTKAPNRTNTNSVAPVDIINVSKLNVAAPQSTVNSLLAFTVPSFSSNTQTISDGTDHIDPASLRGLGPDQVLVLINGKRRHTSSLVNVNGTFGRGNVGTDLNAIPSTALKTIEVLRDGAAAQYGSDAIAGVINARLNDAVNQLSVNVTTGANITDGIGPFKGEKKSMDGEMLKVGVNYGLPLGDKGGYINLTGEYSQRAPTNRMQEFSGNIFSVYNGVERIAMENGFDISSMSIEDIKDNAPGVGYLSTENQASIQMAETIEDIQDILGTDATTDELAARNMERSDFNMRVGQSELKGGQFFANMAIPLGENMELYSFGGASYRNGESGCFYRLPNQSRTTTSIYPNGTVPRINSNITDQSIAAGIRGQIKSWDIDFSNTNGSNQFLYQMSQTHNATLGASSPTDFTIGGHSFSQNTTNFDMTRYLDVGFVKGINIAFGTEYRIENYQVKEGAENSFGNYDIYGNLIDPTTQNEEYTTDILGNTRPSGSQCFAGFLPSNAINANRSSIAGYADVEVDISDALLVSAAVRAEDYSDFGSTFNYKVAARFKVTDNIVVRGTHGTGFRAPSLHQIHFNKTSTIFELIDGVSVANEVGTFSNTSRAAKLLGIPSLKQETSQNSSIGLTFKVPNANLKITVDGYVVDIKDRVILTGQFAAGDDEELASIFRQAGANKAAFFSNAISTNSAGLDIVIAHSMLIGKNLVLKNNFAATLASTQWDEEEGIDGINASELLREKNLVGTYFNQEARIYLEQSVPRVKFTLSNTLDAGKFSLYLRNTYFGQTTEATGAAIFNDDLTLKSATQIEDDIKAANPGISDTDLAVEVAKLPTDPYNSAKIITDLSIGYKFTPALNVTIGANNLLDVYPDEADSQFQSSGRFIYSRRSPQFSFGGRHVFARLSFTL